MATSYAHADVSTDYVLWSRGDTGHALLAKVDPGAPPDRAPVGGWADLGCPDGAGRMWQATSYAHQDAATGYVLWSRNDTGQAMLAKVAVDAGSGAIPVTSWAYLDAPTGAGAPWQATSYTHVDATTGYVLWSRSDAGQAILWKVAPGEVSGTIPVESWEYVSSANGVGGLWRATGYVPGATPRSPAAMIIDPAGSITQDIQ